MRLATLPRAADQGPRPRERAISRSQRSSAGPLRSTVDRKGHSKRRYHRAQGPLKGLTAVAMHHMHRQLKLLPAGCAMCHIVITKAEFATLSPSSGVVSYGESTVTAEDCSVEQAAEKHPNHRIPLTQYLCRSSTEPVVLVLLTIRLGPVSHCSVIGVPALHQSRGSCDDREDSDPEREGEPLDGRRQTRRDRAPDIES